MKDILMMLKDREQELDITCNNFALMKVSCLVKYNEEILYNQLMSYVKSHIYDDIESSTKFLFTMIVDHTIHSIIQNDMEAGKRANIVHLSYCSKEKGTMRALKYEREGYNVYIAQKTPAIFVECNKSRQYYYVIDEEYLQKIKFKLDGFKFFEHILNKLMNIESSVLFHSAAVEYSDKQGIIIIGPKRSGKTTLFLDMIRELECNPVAFDKCHLLKGEEIDVYGMPTRLRVLAGTLSKYGKEMQYLIPEEYRNADSDELWKGKSESKIDMTFTDFERFCQGKKFIKKSRLRYMVIPSVAKDNKEEVRLATYDEFREICMTQIFTPENPEEDWWSECGKNKVQSMKENYEDIIQAIWSSIPIVKISASGSTKNVLKTFEQEYLNK